MNGVLGMLGLALDTELTEEQREYLDTANLSAIALMSVLNDILDFSKIDAGRLDLEHIEFSTREVVDQCLRTLIPESERKQLLVLREISPVVPQVCVGDPNRLRQVLLNLLGNAIKFTARGGIVMKVEVDEDMLDLRLHFQVIDTGVGIPFEKQGAIFEAFSQADRSTTRQFGGTGLGLTISARLVALMNGKIWVENEPGLGSTFHFTAGFGRPPTADSRVRLLEPVGAPPNRI